MYPCINDIYINTDIQFSNRHNHGANAASKGVAPQASKGAGVAERSGYGESAQAAPRAGIPEGEGSAVAPASAAAQGSSGALPQPRSSGLENPQVGGGQYLLDVSIVLY